MTLPNKITIFRLILIPLFVVLYLVEFPYHYLCATFVFITASVSDYFDGHLARKYNLVTDLGKFLDPLADKALVCTALVLTTVIQNTFTLFVLIATIIIIVRELMITAFRTVAASKNIVLAADIWGKIKTMLQMIGLSFYMSYPSMGEILPLLGDICMYIGLVLLLFATVFAIISAVHYISVNHKVFAEDDKS